MSAEQNETRALRAIGYNAHVTVEHATRVAGAAAVRRLEAAGAVQRDEEWTGCLVLTGAGRRRLESGDA